MHVLANFSPDFDAIYVPKNVQDYWFVVLVRHKSPDYAQRLPRVDGHIGTYWKMEKWAGMGVCKHAI